MGNAQTTSKAGRAAIEAAKVELKKSAAAAGQAARLAADREAAVKAGAAAGFVDATSHAAAMRKSKEEELDAVLKRVNERPGIFKKLDEKATVDAQEEDIILDSKWCP